MLHCTPKNCFCRVQRLAGHRLRGYWTTLIFRTTLTRWRAQRVLDNVYFSADIHYKCSQNETTLTRARTRGDWPTLIFRTTLTRLGAAGVLNTLKSKTRQKKISVYPNSEKKSSKCLKMFKNVQKCSKMFKHVQNMF